MYKRWSLNWRIQETLLYKRWSLNWRIQETLQNWKRKQCHPQIKESSLIWRRGLNLIMYPLLYWKWNTYVYALVFAGTLIFIFTEEHDAGTYLCKVHNNYVDESQTGSRTSVQITSEELYNISILSNTVIYFHYM